MTAGYLRWIVLFPLAGAALNIFLGRSLARSAVAAVSCAVVFASFALSCLAFVQLPAGGELVDRVYPWIASGQLSVDLALRVDALTAVMVLVVTGVGFLIHVYSVGYMAHDPDLARYFAYLNLFAGAMLLLVLADNLVVLFVGWEGVGLCSYLLIGFWYDDDEKAYAGNKAFVVNRIGDAGFLLGLFVLFWSLGEHGVWTLSVTEVEKHAHLLSSGTAAAVCLLLFAGATGKSAQIPLYVWLPDAMAGPTPVSALIHAATMVTAGVYMVARLHVLYAAAPVALFVVAGIGAVTAVFAASIGLVQNDIKKILAYSTVSQLGYMFLGVGVGAYGAGIFHLVTHAFFKALLFLGAGSVIHALGGVQDIREMGGLRDKLPVTYWTFFAACLAIAGVPWLSGFFSKDLILEEAYASPHGSARLWALGALGAAMTAFYMFRLLFLAFWGESRARPEVSAHVHESPPSMTVPLVVLAALSVIGGYLPVPGFLAGHFAAAHHPAYVPAAVRYLPTALALAGIGLAYLMYVRSPGLPARIGAAAGGVYRLLADRYRVDELYDAIVVRPVVALAGGLWQAVDVAIIDRMVDGTGEAIRANGRVWRYWQTGNVQDYALSFLVGAVLILGYWMFG